MRKRKRLVPRATKSKKTAPKHNPKSTARHAASAPHGPTPQLVNIVLALDQELAWYFEYAESALRREHVSFLPSYAFAGALDANAPEDAIVRKAHELATTVEGCLRAIPDRHASVIRAAYTPRRWPKNVEKAFASLAPVVIRLAVASDPWPARSAHAGLEDAAASRLSARLASGRGMKVEPIKERAGRIFGSAVRAYAETRAGVASPSPVSQ